MLFSIPQPFSKKATTLVDMADYSRNDSFDEEFLIYLDHYNDEASSQSQDLGIEIEEAKVVYVNPSFNLEHYVELV